MGALTVVGLALVLSVFIVRSEEGTGTCGERKLVGAGLIAHGSTPRAGAWPWHGAMYHRYNPDWIKYMCGVTILTEQFVLTAAHCTYDRWQRLPADRVFIKVGISNLNSPEEFNVDKIIRHEEYDKHTFENDIALLMLSFEITYTSYIQPICLWQNDTELSKIISKTGYVVGWGLDETYSFPKKLSEATMPIVSSTECRKRNTWHYYKFYFESKTFCAGRPNDTHVSAGDSGGGFYMRMGSNWVLRGIVSSAKINAITLNIQADSYTIFTDVAYYLNWIKTRVPDIPYFAVDTEQTTETAFNGDVHLLDLENCGKYTYKPGTHEEGYELVNLYPWEAVIKFVGDNLPLLIDSMFGSMVCGTMAIAEDAITQINSNLPVKNHL
ncbi:serine protease gd-like [Aedes albopictus]|uniref:Peptidase S1 domain-containing protein n=1 Tax=Aedes albopictus TaxID=7160 RepID=A0ABM1Y4M5_AEDAL